jgi:subtilisin family serine protease
MLLPTLATLLFPVQEAAPLPSGATRLVPDQLTVILEAPAADPAAWLAEVGLPTLEGARVLRANHLGIVDLQLAPGAPAEAALAQLAGRDDVRTVERVHEGRYFDVPDDPQFASQDYLRNVGQTGGVVDADVDAERAWDVTTGNPQVVIASIDSGIDDTHPDLAPNLWLNTDEVPGNGLDDDGNGFVDDVRGWNFQLGDGTLAGGLHGTWVAGTISARRNNGFGIAGLAGGDGAQPGCRLMSLGVGAQAPSVALVDDAIVYAADNGARVITMSLGLPTSAAVELAVEYAVNEKGCFVDCASGNGFFGGGPVSFPATIPDVVAVGGTTANDTWWPTANFGPEIRVAAMAQNVLTTRVGGGTEVVSGTSFAAPQVAALAGLVWSVNPDLTAQEVLFLIGGTADDVEAPGFDVRTGLGRINAWRAVLAAADPDCDGNGQIDAFEIAMGMAVDVDGDDVLDSCQSLFPGLAERSLSAGGDLPLDLRAGAALAGQAYFLFGSATSTVPTIPLGDVELPLSFDDYTLLTAVESGSAPFLGFNGVLDAQGEASATLAIAAGTEPTLAGAVLYHAFVTVDLATAGVTSASNPAALELLP